MSFYPGQRWFSSSEPDLGLGVIEAIEGRQIIVQFPAQNISRRYAQNSAPLQRAILGIGQVIRSKNTTLEIEKVQTENQLLIYSGEGKVICETDLDATVDVSTPENRLNNMQFDNLTDFDIRKHALCLNYDLKSSHLRGFFGGRIQLFDHQLSVAHRACSQNKVRVLLGDEVGLGKTIEALLIMHRLLLDDRIKSALIVVPSSLVHQWLAEAYLRFNLILRVLGVEAYHGAQEDYIEDALTDSNLFVVPIDQLAPEIIEQGWDLLVIDEAHHLTPDHNYWEAISSLCHQTKHCLFLSAIPTRNNQKSHDARLRLLENIRDDEDIIHHDNNKMLMRLADIVSDLQCQQKLKKIDIDFLEEQLDETFKETEEIDRQKQINHLFDLQGLGRTRFRNTRSSIPGFPKRIGHHTVLDNGDLQLLRKEFIQIKDEKLDIELSSQDARIDWLKNWLANHKKEKVLILCASSYRAESLAKMITNNKQDIVVFHENMGLLERDRHAAPFLDPDGPSIAIISPIGAEGRNFQIASHLIIFDLPWGADRIEQAIGRIDRIGQVRDVHIHTVSFRNSPQYGLIKWYNKTLRVFEKPWHGSSELEQNYLEPLFEALVDVESSELDSTIKNGIKTNLRLQKEMADGRDRLLELSSFDPILGRSLQDSLTKRESRKDLENFMLQTFENYGMSVEYIGDRSYDVRKSEANYDLLPGWIGESMVFTFNRNVALRHPERVFLNPDHPMLRDLLDVFLSSPKGNSVIALHSDINKGIFIEAQFIAQQPMNITERIRTHWTPTPINVTIDEKNNLGQTLDIENLKAANKKIVFKTTTKIFIKKQLAKARRIAEEKATIISAKINKQAIDECTLELEKIGSTVTLNSQRIRTDREFLQKEIKEIHNFSFSPRIRLDSVRVSLPSKK